MSEVHDSWLEGIGVDVQGILGSISDAGSGAPPLQEAPSQSDFTGQASSAVSAVGSNASTAPDAKGSSDGGTLTTIGSLASDAWEATKGAAGAGYNAYQESTDFKPVASGEGSNVDWSGSKPISVTQALGAGVDWYEKSTEDNSKKMVASAEGIPVLEQLAQASAFVNDTTANVGGGVVRGVGDLAGGLANAVFHPIDAAAGIEGILEHNSPIPGLGSTLKAAHGAYDIATGNEKGEYGSSWGDLASNVLDPRKQQEDDAKFNSNLVRGIVAPGTKDWNEAYDKLKENPADMLARAGTNVLPIALGLGEAAAGDAAAEVTNATPKGAVIEPPPTLKTPYLPEGVPAPEPFNPDIPSVGPGDLPSPSSSSSTPATVREPSPVTQRSPGIVTDPDVPNGPTVINPDGGPVQINPTHPFYPDAGAPTVPAPDLTLPPDTISDPPQFPRLPGEPITPEPVPKLPGGPKEGLPIPREDPVSGLVDTPRQPMDIPGLLPEEPLPSTKPLPSTTPDGPITQDAAPSQGSAVPTERGLGGMPAIPRGMDPGALVQLVLDTPGGKSVVELMQELGMPVERR